LNYPHAARQCISRLAPAQRNGDIGAAIKIARRALSMRRSHRELIAGNLHRAIFHPEPGKGLLMRPYILALVVITAAAVIYGFSIVTANTPEQEPKSRNNHDKGPVHSVQLGPRPYFLIDDMDEGELKAKLQQCSEGPFKKTDFSLGHRGAPLQFPEHTKESYKAAARMGAAILDCDVTFTKDRELVCRHAQCDLHTTTNILATPLAAKCSVPFSPAVIDPETGVTVTPATAKCCTSDLTLAEFKTLQGKMDAFNPKAKTVQEYMNATARFRTDLYASKGTLLSHKESIALFKRLGTKFAPELKPPDVAMPYQGDYTQADYAQQMIDEYKATGVAPQSVFVQSFNLDDVLYWIQNEPAFGKQAVYLERRVFDPAFDHTKPASWKLTMEQLVAKGVKTIGPPMWMLVKLDGAKIVPSAYANAAKAAGLDIIAWTLERTGPLNAGGGWYYQTTNAVINNDGDTMTMLDVLAKDVGVLGVASDWPATVTYYANCMNLN
jgi:glycerophosphoryl diester phosphodiesterase